MTTTTIQNRQKVEHLRRIVQEQFAHFEETGEQRYTLMDVVKLIGYKDRHRIRNTIFEMFSRELYNRIFGGLKGGKRVMTEQKLIDIIKELGLRKSGIQGIVTERGIRIFRAALEGKIAPTSARVELFCQIEGHSPWEALVSNVISKGTWCRKCAAERRAFTWADAYVKGLTKNPSAMFYLKETPETLAIKIRNRPKGIGPSMVKLDWECEEGHKLSISYEKIGRSGCRHCARISQAITYKYAKKVAVAKGYKLVTTPIQFKKLMEQAFKDKVTPSRVKLKYSCGKHDWYATHTQMMTP